MQPGTITLCGEVGFDFLTILAGQARAYAGAPQDVEVHWSEAQWVHFACLQFLIALKRTLEQSGKHLVVSEPSRRVAQLLRDFNMTTLVGAG